MGVVSLPAEPQSGAEQATDTGGFAVDGARVGLGRGAAFLTASSMAFLLAGYVTNVWLGRRLGPTQYGLYGVVVTFISAVNVMQVFGVPQALARRVAEDPEHEFGALRTALRLQMALTVVLTIALVALASPVAAALGDHRLTGYLRVSALILPVYGLFSVYGGFHNGRHHFARQAGMVGLYALGKAVFVVALGAVAGLYGALSGFILAPIAAILVGMQRVGRTRPAPARGMVALSVPLVVYAGLSTLQLSVDLLLVKGLSSRGADAGYYAAAQNMAVIPYYAVSAASQVLFPSVARHLKDGDVRRAADTVSSALRFTLLLLFPGVVLVAVSRHDLVVLLYSHRYDASATSLAVLVVGYGALALFSLFGFVLNGGGRTRFAPICAGSGVVTSIVVCSVLIPDHGLVGAAIGSAAGSGVAMVMGAIGVARLLELRVPVASIARAALGAAAAGAVIAVLHTRPLLLPAAYVAALAAYLAVLALTREPALSDLVGLMRKFVGRRRVQP